MEKQSLIKFISAVGTKLPPSDFPFAAGGFFAGGGFFFPAPASPTACAVSACVFIVSNILRCLAGKFLVNIISHILIQSSIFSVKSKNLQYTEVKSTNN